MSLWLNSPGNATVFDCNRACKTHFGYSPSLYRQMDSWIKSPSFALHLETMVKYSQFFSDLLRTNATSSYSQEQLGSKVLKIEAIFSLNSIASSSARLDCPVKKVMTNLRTRIRSDRIVFSYKNNLQLSCFASKFCRTTLHTDAENLSKKEEENCSLLNEWRAFNGNLRFDIQYELSACSSTIPNRSLWLLLYYSYGQEAINTIWIGILDPTEF